MALTTIIKWIAGIVGLAILYKIGQAYPTETVIALSVVAILIIAVIILKWGKDE